MKKVCFLTNNINQVGGIERLISLLSYGFLQMNEVSLTILSLYSNPSDHSYFAISNKTSCIHANLPLNQHVDDYLIRFFHNNPFDDLVTFHSGIALVVARIIRKIKPIRWIATEHNYPGAYTRKRRLLNLFVYRKTDCFVVLTDEIADYYRSRFIRNIMVIPNPVSFIVHESNSYPHNIIAVGRVEEIKRYDLLVKAFGNIEDKFPDWKLRIVGGGTQFDFLAQKAQEYKNIELLGPGKDIKELMLDSSFLVISSQFEAFPLVALEAMECGLPIISTQLPSLKFMTRGYDTVIYVDRNDCNDFSEKMERLMSNPSLVRNMGTEAKECAKQYHIDNILKYWNAIL